MLTSTYLETLKSFDDAAQTASTIARMNGFDDLAEAFAPDVRTDGVDGIDGSDESDEVDESADLAALEAKLHDTMRIYADELVSFKISIFAFLLNLYFLIF